KRKAIVAFVGGDLVGADRVMLRHFFRKFDLSVDSNEFCLYCAARRNKDNPKKGLVIQDVAPRSWAQLSQFFVMVYVAKREASHEIVIPVCELIRDLHRRHLRASAHNTR